MRNFTPDIFSSAACRRRPLILDGAMGSLLESSGIPSEGSLWTSYASRDYPETVLRIHRSYIQAGADIITTNTFRTNPASAGSQSEELVKKAVEIARLARNDTGVLIAGSNAPAEDCYKAERHLAYRDLEYNHHWHISSLIEHGCDFLLNETQSHLDEVKIICRYCYENSLPFVLSFFFSDRLELLSGHKLSDAVKLAIDSGAMAVGFNCISRKEMILASESLDLSFNWGMYLNVGSACSLESRISHSGKIERALDEKGYLETIKKLRPYHPSFIGACCGSDANYIKTIKEYYDGLSGN